MDKKKIANKKSVSAVVPVFQEEKTVYSVVTALIKNPLINEVICVNDGSKDKSLEILKQFGERIKLINLTKNYGKGYAISQGVRAAKGEIVAFFDADLVNLKENHIKKIITPLLTTDVRSVIGHPIIYPKKFWHLMPFLKNLSGERAYYKNDLVPYLADLSKTRFGAEVFLNQIFKKLKTKEVPLENLNMLFKHNKFTKQKAIMQWTKEVAEVTQQIGKTEVPLPRSFQKVYLGKQLFFAATYLSLLVAPLIFFSLSDHNSLSNLNASLHSLSGKAQKDIELTQVSINHLPEQLNITPYINKYIYQNSIF